ncbi:hypothetical protein SSAG_06461 [Streptomyces sp. Mg1]|nr:hypothetical protein SSAG_06461 [Streptomyces sp. Mg1]
MSSDALGVRRSARPGADRAVLVLFEVRADPLEQSLIDHL